jgi:mxaA protein
MTPFLRSMHALLILSALALTTPLAYAIDSQNLPDIDPGYVTISTVEPVKLVGYTVGDIIEREVVLIIKAPYKLIETSLPITGYEKRYKGQLLGIELKSISHTKKEEENSSRHVIHLAYQVFTNNVVAKNAALGPEYLNLVNTKNNKQIVKYRIPSLSIAISPLAIFGQVKIENNMSTYLGPLLLPADNESYQLKASLVALTLSLLGLLYIFGRHAWLPRMGGTFAKTYRAIRKLPHSSAGLKQAVASVHTAINSSASISIFSNNIDQFLAQKPSFSPLKAELEEFFGISRQLYFESHTPDSLEKTTSTQLWLQMFVRRCRDCERGLIPDPVSTKQKSGQ